MPSRIQMTRQRPWRSDHPDAVIVARPGPWGNPFRIGHMVSVEVYPPGRLSEERWACAIPITRELAVDLLRAWILARPAQVDEIREEFAGRDVACWCALDAACHGDVYLEIANSAPTHPADQPLPCGHDQRTTT